MEYEVCPTLLHMASTGNRTPDLLILSSTPYPLGHMLPYSELILNSNEKKNQIFFMLQKNTHKEVRMAYTQMPGPAYLPGPVWYPANGTPYPHVPAYGMVPYDQYAINQGYPPVLNTSYIPHPCTRPPDMMQQQNVCINLWNSWRDIEGRGKNCEGRTARGDQRGENCEGRTARVRGEGER